MSFYVQNNFECGLNHIFFYYFIIFSLSKCLKICGTQACDVGCIHCIKLNSAHMWCRLRAQRYSELDLTNQSAHNSSNILQWDIKILLWKSMWLIFPEQLHLCFLIFIYYILISKCFDRKFQKLLLELPCIIKNEALLPLTKLSWLLVTTGALKNLLCKGFPRLKELSHKFFIILLFKLCWTIHKMWLHWRKPKITVQNIQKSTYKEKLSTSALGTFSNHFIIASCIKFCVWHWFVGSNCKKLQLELNTELTIDLKYRKLYFVKQY